MPSPCYRKPFTGGATKLELFCLALVNALQPHFSSLNSMQDGGLYLNYSIYEEPSMSGADYPHVAADILPGATHGCSAFGCRTKCFLLSRQRTVQLWNVVSTKAARMGHVVLLYGAIVFLYCLK